MKGLSEEAEQAEWGTAQASRCYGKRGRIDAGGLGEYSHLYRQLSILYTSLPLKVIGCVVQDDYHRKRGLVKLGSPLM